MRHLEPDDAPAESALAVLRGAVELVVARQIQPLLKIHGGGVRVLDVTPEGEVRLEFLGACRGCALKSVTYVLGLRQKLLPVPGVSAVTVEGVRLSDHAIRRAEDLHNGYAPWVGTSGTPAS